MLVNQSQSDECACFTGLHQLLLTLEGDADVGDSVPCARWKQDHLYCGEGTRRQRSQKHIHCWMDHRHGSAWPYATFRGQSPIWSCVPGRMHFDKKNTDTKQKGPLEDALLIAFMGAAGWARIQNPNFSSFPWSREVWRKRKDTVLKLV